MRDRSCKSGLRLLLRDFGSGHAAILTPNGSQLGTRPSAAGKHQPPHYPHRVRANAGPAITHPAIPNPLIQSCRRSLTVQRNRYEQQ